MNTCDRRIFELLPWYANGSLSPEEEQEVEAHLKVCPICRKELREIKTLTSGIKEHEEVFASSHIESEKLVIFAEEPETLNPDEVTGIVRHLQSCSECHEELQTLKRADLELEALEKKERPQLAKEESVWGRISQRLIWLVGKPAFAYIIVILLAYPAARWWFTPSEPGMLPTPKVASERVYLLSEQTRVAAEPALVARDGRQKEVRLGAHFYPDLENSSYDLMINSESGQTIFAIKDFTDFGHEGFFQLVLNTDFIPDGQYALIVRETNREDPTVSSETYFPFQIIEGKE